MCSQVAAGHVTTPLPPRLRPALVKTCRPTYIGRCQPDIGPVSRPPKESAPEQTGPACGAGRHAALPAVETLKVDIEDGRFVFFYLSAEL